ncbi:MAG TPA: hypothetical protein VFQ32_13095 [Ktedonobacterales bacterium]|nr:hypothetical protein [Ktedonobacterales bacterium]
MAKIGTAQTSGAAGADDPYGAGRQAQGSGMAPLELVAGEASGAAEGLLGALIELIGVEGSSLAGALAAWQREQDRLANRAWRRPGGMARPAGL